MPGGGPTVNRDLSYILGVLCGDGSFSSTKGGYRTGTVRLSSIDKEFTNSFKDRLESYTGLHIQIYEVEKNQQGWSNVYKISKTSKELLFLERFETRCDKWEVPSEILEDEELMAPFLKGLFDSDGHCEFSDDRGSSIRITSSNKSGLEQVKELLNSIGIENNVRVNKTETSDGRVWYRLIIGNLDDKKIFSEKVGSSIPRKKEDLNKLVDEYENCSYRRYTKKEEKFLKENYQRMEYSEIAEKLGRSTHSVIAKKSNMGLPRKTRF